MPPTLAEIQNHIEQGYFTNEDMQVLGLKGFVSLQQIKAELASLLSNQVQEPPPPPPPTPEELAAAAEKKAEEDAIAERNRLVLLMDKQHAGTPEE